MQKNTYIDTIKRTKKRGLNINMRTVTQLSTMKLTVLLTSKTNVARECGSFQGIFRSLLGKSSTMPTEVTL